MQRRGFIRSLGAGLAAVPAVGSAIACAFDEDAIPTSTPEESDAVFPQGVASGDPTPTTVILWTRVEPVEGQSHAVIDVRVQLADDEAFESIVLDSAVPAGPEWDHTLRIRISSLDPGRTYFYRYVSQDVTSVIGRTRTAPAEDAIEDVRFAVASCQEYVGRWYHAWREMLGDQPHFVLFLGDYIYENVADPRYQEVGSERSVSIPDGLSLDGSETNLAAVTLEDYRAIYKQIRSDPDLREAHRLFPFITIWDDHEFTNDCWQDVANEFNESQGEERDTSRRSAASRAWFEFVPVDVEYDIDASFPDDLAIHRSLRWGAHCELVLSDVRYYRDDHVVAEGPVEPLVGKYWTNSALGARVLALKEGFDALEAAASPTMLGDAQRTATIAALTGSEATWTLWCQPMLVAEMLLDLRDFEELPSLLRNVFYFKLDHWDGYRTERRAILEACAGVENLVVLSGDLHGNYAAELRADFDDPATPATATELMVTGISSMTLQEQLERFVVEDPTLAGLGLEQVTAQFDATLQATSPHIRYANSSAYGYLLVELGEGDLDATFVEIERVRDPDGPGRIVRQPVRIANGAAAIQVL